MSRQKHWQQVYASKDETAVSWFQAVPQVSLRMIHDTGLEAAARIVDVGGGASRLVDHLLDRGFQHLSVLDIARGSLEHAKNRLGPRADVVEWIVSDVTAFRPERTWDLWHDRAVFHFLVDEADRADYVQALKRALAPGGHTILATFGPEGPERCSGLPVVRYDAAALQVALGSEFKLVEQEIEHHQTPSGAIQEFLYCRFQHSG
jgi:SAM-dependent methyltransferase